MNTIQCQICLDVKNRSCFRYHICVVCKNSLLMCFECYLSTSTKNIYYYEEPSQRINKGYPDKIVHICSINCFLNYERNNVIQLNELMKEHQENLLQLAYVTKMRMLLNNSINLIKDLNEIIIEFIEIQK